MQTGIESSGQLFYQADIFRLEIMRARITLGGLRFELCEHLAASIAGFNESGVINTLL